MKSLLLCFCFAVVSCTTPGEFVKGDLKIKSSGRVGGRGMISYKNPTTGEELLMADNNDASFREFNKTARFGAGTIGAISIVKNLSGAATAISKDKTAADVAKVGLKETTKQKEIQSVTDRMALEVMEEEVPEVGAGVLGAAQ